MNKIILFFLLSFLSISISGLAQLRVEDLPNAKERKNENFYDGSDRLKAFEKDSLNNYLKRIETELGYEIAVVLLNSIDGQNTHDFALNLFNYWGIGSSRTDNGLLILVVLEARRTEFITGTGLEGVLPDALCFKIQKTQMNPHFKNGDFYLGLRKGIKTVEDIYRGNPVEYLEETLASGKRTSSQSNQNSRGKSSSWMYSLLWKYLIVLAIVFGVCLVLILTSFFIKDLVKRYNLIKVSDLLIWKILFPIPFLVLYWLVRRLMNQVRYRTRYSPTTGNELHLLSEEEDDSFLTKVQIAKEKIGSFDYDVWISEDMEEFVIIPYKTWFKFVRKCPKCKERTQVFKSNTVTRSATYSSSGSGYKTYKCENCKHVVTKHYTIPRKTPPSSSNSSYSSSSSSSWSSGSSSSGGSWGGGSSSGGGAGSSW